MLHRAEHMNSIFISLFRYKAWANVELHNTMANFNAGQRPDEFQAMLCILDHANVVDQIFKNHLAGTNGQIFTTTSSEKIPNLAELREIVSATDSWYIEFVSSISDERLKQRVQFTFTDGDSGAMSCEEILLHVVTHSGYHRGSVGQMLETMGVDSPPDSLTKFLHRHEPERRIRV